MDLQCYYVVKARTAFYNSKTGEIEFRARIKKFENENTIEARKAAFDFRNEFVCGLLTLGLNLKEEEIGWSPQTKEIENLSDREIRKLLNPFLEQDNSEQITILNKEDDTEEIIDWMPPDDSISWYSQFNNGIWVIFVHNDTELQRENEIVIDKITKYEEPLPSPPLYDNLEVEYEFYKKHNFDTENFEATTHFFDDEEFSEGFYIDDHETEEEAQERHLEGSFKTFKFLKTPFDWNGYDKIYWWEKVNTGTTRELNELPITISEAFSNGESHFVEFKPGLINWKNSDRDIEFEVAQTLCAFLNAKGGYLFIGIADRDKEVYGVKFPDNSKDKFLREFTRVKARYLPPYLAHSINGDFYSIENKNVFVITGFPNSEPVFLRRKDELNKLTSKEFYIRSDASSRHLYDIEEIVRYCRKRDKDNFNND